MSQLESEVQSSRSTIGQLQDQLAEERRRSQKESKVLQRENKNLAVQVSNSVHKEHLKEAKMMYYSITRLPYKFLWAYGENYAHIHW